MANLRRQLAALFISGFIPFQTGSGWAAENRADASRSDEPVNRFATFPIESLERCDGAANELCRRVAGTKVAKAFVTPNQLRTITGYWLDTADGGSIGLVCFGKTAMLFGQRNPLHLKRGSFMGMVSNNGPQCRYPQNPEVFYQDQNVTIFWEHRHGDDDVMICIPGVASIALSRVRA